MIEPEDLYKEIFKDYAPEPPESVWSGIERRLSWRRFLTFRPLGINIYYAAAAVAAVSLMALSGSGGGSGAIAIMEPASPTASAGLPQGLIYVSEDSRPSSRPPLRYLDDDSGAAQAISAAEAADCALPDSSENKAPCEIAGRAIASPGARDMASSAPSSTAMQEARPAPGAQPAAPERKCQVSASIRAMGQSVAMEAVGRSERLSYAWDFGDGHQAVGRRAFHSYKQPGSYKIRLLAFSKADNISDTIIKEVAVSAPEYSVTFPNAQVASLSAEPFLPKGDVGEITRYSISIYSRSGQEVFSSRNAQQGWNGYYKGERLPKGVYVYRAACVFSNGETSVSNGSITLLWEENANLIIHP